MDRIKQVIEAKYPNVRLNKWIETQPKTITFEELWQRYGNAPLLWRGGLRNCVWIKMKDLTQILVEPF